MPYHPDDTICAIATATGGAARGMVRISGPRTISIVSQLFDADNGTSLVDIRLPTAIAGRVRADLAATTQPVNTFTAASGRAGGAKLPCDLFLWPTARSYTREPVAELHTFGSRPLLEGLLAAVCQADARLAEPGEFTLRAFLAGRLDLTQAEAVLGVIDARGGDELRGALAQLAGGLARPMQKLRDDLLQLLAELEAGLDFVEEDIEFVASTELSARLDSTLQVLEGISAQMESRHTAGVSAQIALVGEPNAGKSSLFNALLTYCRDEDPSGRAPRVPAIVSARRGTTRDYLMATILVDGLPCELIDTAGIDGERPSEIDAAAQSLAVERHNSATIRVCCIDPAHRLTSATTNARPCDVFVLTKSDIAPREHSVAEKLPVNVPVVVTSSVTHQGLDNLCAVLRQLLLSESAAQQGQVVGATVDRCREGIRLATAALDAASDLVRTNGGNELVAAELRIALSELGKVVGAVYTDDLLDRIFSTFCIGK